jgi:hypothetical protein
VLTVLSLGAGVQSTTVALMAAVGGLPRLDCAIFADTGWEPEAVYRHLEWLEGVLPFPVYRVQRGILREDVLNPQPGKQMANPPFFTLGADGSRGMLRRQCTETYKVQPIQQKVRALLGIGPRQQAPREPVAEQWLGISLDEAHRMKPSRLPYVVHRWPLVDLRMRRQDCLRWLAERGYPEPPKSACIGCPYHSDAMWRRMRDETPGEWQDAVDFERAVLRDGVRGVRDAVYLHAQRVPLNEVDLSTSADRGQLELGFGNECEGVCGV